ncbi:hypothetical protein ACIQV3_10985 [Streptomyces sp. NPDC099050]|uniref:hypothetical protein n=1 Tax=Streptomyces sp. NPDC099050 TaxID=3366100 RepID=UPI0037F6EF1F
MGKAATVGGTIVWQDLTNTVATMTDPANPNYPANVCGVAILAQGNNAYVKVVTSTGTVWQTHGDINNNTFVWDEGWVQRATPTPAVLVRGAFKGDLMAEPAHRAKPRK